MFKTNNNSKSRSGTKDIELKNQKMNKTVDNFDTKSMLSTANKSDI